MCRQTGTKNNLPEPLHVPFHPVFIRFQHANPKIWPPVFAIRAFGVPNNLYVSGVISAYEAAKGFTHHISSDTYFAPVDEELLGVHAILVARRRLTRTLRSHSFTNDNFRPGDLEHVFQENGHQKREKWLSPGK